MTGPSISGTGRARTDCGGERAQIHLPEKTKDNPLGVGYLSQHVGALHEQINRLEESTNGLHGIADRLFGSKPSSDADKKEAATLVEACPDGMIGQCQLRVEQLENVVERVNFALERLQQVA